MDRVIGIYTDLACEKKGGFRDGVTRTTGECQGFHIERQSAACITPNGLSDKDEFFTVFAGEMWQLEEDERERLCCVISSEIKRMTQSAFSISGTPTVLCVGLGNGMLTADAIGPETVSRLTVTRHIKDISRDLFDAMGGFGVCAVAPGVVGQTGIETAELVLGAVKTVSPQLVIAIDSLAARSLSRLAATLQLSNNGISPGSGMNNRRKALNMETLGVPVLALGIPTVVSASSLVFDFLERTGIGLNEEKSGRISEEGDGFFVGPKNSDIIRDCVSGILADAIDAALTR